MDGFLLSRSDRTLRTAGTRDRYDTVAAAAAALADGRVELVVGALPFDPSAPTALTAPASAAWTDGPWRPDTVVPLPRVTIAGEVPSPAEHVARVRRLVDRLRGGEFDKVVAARAVRLTADAPIDPEALAARMIRRHETANGFAVDLTASGEGYRGHTLVGASPEILLGRRGDVVTCRPLAGSAPRRADPDADQAEGAELLASAKNLAEHAYVVEWIREVLAPLCAELDVPASPELTRTGELWHLASPIRGRLLDGSVSSLELARRLHPTPAVCGTPTDRALDAIRDVEGDRRFYGGAVGWCDRAGDGDWVVAIRCAEIDADGTSALAWAGGGIVAASDPDTELAETTTKLGTLLGALGVDARAAAPAGDTLTRTSRTHE
ncbi:isochorismate synthase [Prescottella equi]|uniref:isochorismate synthase n=1 Tax=Rhodococcus hoagii TaxID=43767 RepID=A0A9Q5EZ62_RHOHA|nr:isochorismate synthase [Prescottella equi]MBM4491281.1 isochorismate synthase [Prescottella equi]MBM4497160.1 isochorismate synthase [Prescottella equi]MBM4502234.1 isochorismate synthase [Prescottella equi]MBM4506074.1 isochorismate synthase [Prescottella equi]MBM4512930.1 isochorismate synthase [Prescottella equi]